MTFYQDKFFKNRHERTLYSAELILSIIFEILPKIESAVDIGCGVGTWLSVLKERGINDIQGVDGNWVNEKYLQIPRESFMPLDFTKENSSFINRRFDLGISLEVAEHLPKERAIHFVNLLTNLSDFILFSAAIPHQGGRNHINEQWLDYWLENFQLRGFVGLDLIRRKIWNDENILPWYKQNTILLVRKDRIQELKLNEDITNLHPLSIVHPHTYLEKMNQLNTLKDSLSTVKFSWKCFLNAIKKNFAIGAKRNKNRSTGTH